jgi:hypothetical protein
MSEIEDIKQRAQPVTATAMLASLGSGIPPLAIFKTDFTPGLRTVMEANLGSYEDAPEHAARWILTKDDDQSFALIFDIEWIYPAEHLYLWIPVKRFKVELGVVRDTHCIGLAPTGPLTMPNVIGVMGIPVDVLSQALRMVH